MPILQNNYVQIILNSITVYLFIIIAIRLFGKKELSQLSVIDLVFVLLISNSVQNAMVGSDSTLLGGLIAAFSLFIVNYVFKQFNYRFPRFSRLIQGESVLLIYDGVPNQKNIAASMITMDELMEAIREHGVSRIEDVNLAILEVDGNISILTNNFQHKSKKKAKQSEQSK